MKGFAINYMTKRIETLEKESQDLSAIRQKVEAFDIKNAELLQRAGKQTWNWVVFLSFACLLTICFIVKLLHI
jgi:hypothetical protein